MPTGLLSTWTRSPSASQRYNVNGVFWFVRSHGTLSKTATADGAVGVPVTDHPAPSMCNFPVPSATAASHSNTIASIGDATSDPLFHASGRAAGSTWRDEVVSQTP